MKSNKRFFNFIKNNKSTELYVYGAIVSGAYKWDETDVTFTDFRDTLDAMEDGSTLDMMINSCGGDVFTTQSIIAMLRRAKERNITINAYIDGIGASCASWLPMIADNVYIYPQSILMVHKPLCGVMGNANDMKKEIEILDKIEEDVIIPLYLSKAKEGVTKELLQEKMAEETWMSSNEILEMFNVTLLEDTRKIACCIDREIMNSFVNIPENIQALLNKEETNMADEKNKVEVLDEVTETPVDEVIETVESLAEEVEDNAVEEETTEVEAPVVEETEESAIDEVKTEEAPSEEVETSETVENSIEEDNITDLENKIQALQNEKVELENKLNEANEKVIQLNEKVNELAPIVDKYNEEMAQKKAVEDKKLIDEKREFYKNKFEKLGGRNKFESEEVQNLIGNCINDEQAVSKLNLMLVEMIQVPSIDNKVVTNRYEAISKVENLIPTEETIENKYGFQ